jgi:DNA-binding PadR family transcriptional regulator
MGSLSGLPEAHFHILLALADTPRHGYSIMQEVASLTGGKTKLSPGTLYGALQRLLEQGWIEEVRGRTTADERRRLYAITREGRTAASTEVERLRALVEKACANGLAPKRRPV